MKHCLVYLLNTFVVIVWCLMYVGDLFNLIERAENDYLSDMQDE